MLFPLAHAEIFRLIERKPHDEYGKIASREGRKIAAIQFAKCVVLFPGKTVLYSGMNLLLIIKKTGQLVIKLFASLKPSSERSMGKRKCALMVVDYFFLLFVVPAMRVAGIGKLLLAATAYPGLLFKSEEAIYSPVQQESESSLEEEGEVVSQSSSMSQSESIE